MHSTIYDYGKGESPLAKSSLFAVRIKEKKLALSLFIYFYHASQGEEITKFRRAFEGEEITKFRRACEGEENIAFALDCTFRTENLRF